jgi:branched-chain amino acid transport system substrate-binding protein
MKSGKLGARHFLVASCLAIQAVIAVAETVKVGITVPTSGPAAILGIGAKNAFAMFPAEIGNYKIEYTLLDDASDPTSAVTNAKRFVAAGVDVIVGSSTSPQCMAMIEVAAESETPMIALGSSSRIVEPMDGRRKWVFKTSANDSLMASAVAEHMIDSGVVSVAFIGYSDAYGESWLNEFSKLAATRNLKIVDIERFSPRDTSVTAQVLKALSAQPDAVLIAGSGTPTAMPHIALRDLGYKGRIYQTHGAASTDFLRVGGKALEGGYVPVGPNLVWEQLPVDYPTRKASADFVPKYESRYGKNSRSNFAAQAYDVLPLLERALPEAGRSAKPGTPEFRRALRAALEGVKDLKANAGVFNMSAEDHSGLDQRARVMVRIQSGTWVLDKTR